MPLLTHPLAQARVGSGSRTALSHRSLAQAGVAASPDDPVSPSKGSPASSGVQMNQYCNDDAALAMREVQVDQGGNDEYALASSNDALASSDVQVHQHGHTDGTSGASDDALPPSHDNVLAYLDIEVGQGGNNDGALTSPLLCS